MARTVRDRLERGITVADLIAELEGMDPEAIPVFLCDYGDHCHTTMALPIVGVREIDGSAEYIGSTAYSYSEMCLRERKEDDDGSDDDEGDLVSDGVVILS